jgi:5-methylcytosine-specific restriction endonuclease McrA
MALVDPEPPQLAFGEATRPVSGLDEDEHNDLVKEEAYWWIARMREQLKGITSYQSRLVCPDCGIKSAAVAPSNGQNVVRCAKCGRHLYNAPKTETGERARTVDTLRHAIKPSQQARILDRDHRTGVLCGRADVQLTIGHLLSIEEGVSVGASESELYNDANLAAMCESCNLGLGRHSISPRTYAVIMLHLERTETLRRTKAERLHQR